MVCTVEDSELNTEQQVYTQYTLPWLSMGMRKGVGMGMGMKLSGKWEWVGLLSLIMGL